MGHLMRTVDGHEYVTMPGGRVFFKKDLDELSEYVRKMHVARYEDFDKFQSDKSRVMRRLALDTELFGPVSPELLDKWVNSDGGARELGNERRSILSTLAEGAVMMAIAVLGFVAFLAFIPLIVTSFLGFTPWWSSPAAFALSVAVVFINDRNEKILNRR